MSKREYILDEPDRQALKDLRAKYFIILGVVSFVNYLLSPLVNLFDLFVSSEFRLITLFIIAGTTMLGFVSGLVMARLFPSKKWTFDQHFINLSLVCCFVLYSLQILLWLSMIYLERSGILYT